MTNYRPGSAGEKEAKGYKKFLIVSGVVTVLALCLEFLIPSELRDNVKAAPGWLNVLGFILTAGSWGMLYKGTKAGEEGSAGYTIGWVVLLALGIFASAGGYSYTY